MSLIAAATALAGAIAVSDAYAQIQPLDIPIVYLGKAAEHPPTLSNFDPIPEDQGLQGARLGVKDNATTGKFLKHAYSISEVEKQAGDDILPDAKAALAGGPKIAILNMPRTDLLAVADLPEAADDLLFNAGAADVDLRDKDCRKNVLHTLPSRDMLADGLMQFLIKRQWTDIFLIVGHYPTDKALGDAFRSAATKFNVNIVIEKQWLENADIRRNAMQEVPLFTQGDDYDVVVVADEEEQFGTFFQYNTWIPRPVMGSDGLIVAGWSPVMEQWAAIQLQERFQKFADRKMNSVDYAAWLGARTIGEAVTRTKSNDLKIIREFILSEQFTLDGFKGSRLSYRTWNGQLRQPIPLASEDALVTLTPLEGFLHQRTELDTLGLDEPESQCKAME
ncbi:MAG: ABC transporter substrate-binding protein [Rhizobiaceae bacterium]